MWSQAIWKLVVLKIKPKNLGSMQAPSPLSQQLTAIGYCLISWLVIHLTALIFQA